MKERRFIRTQDGRIGLDMLGVLNETLSEIDLETFRPGDVLAVETRHSTYLFEKNEGTKWRVSTTNPERKHLIPPDGGAVEIHGCTFGGSMIKQNCVFVGGYLEFSGAGVGIVTTSVVMRIRAQQKMDAA